MDIINYKLNPEFKDDFKRGVSKIKNKDLHWLFGVCIFNILFELFIRKVFSNGVADFIVEPFHVLIYMGTPLFFIFRNKVPGLFLAWLLISFFTVAAVYPLTELGKINPYFNLLFVFLLFGSFVVLTKNKNIKSYLLLNVKNIFLVLFWGILASIFIAGHIYFVTSLSHVYPIRPLPLWYFLPRSFYLVFEIFILEIFYRGFIFRKMNFELKIPFWLSALISTFFYVGPFLTNSMFNNNYRLLIGVSFYTLLSGFVSCALIKKTKSIFPSYITNVAMNILRYLILV